MLIYGCNKRKEFNFIISNPTLQTNSTFIIKGTRLKLMRQSLSHELSTVTDVCCEHVSIKDYLQDVELEQVEGKYGIGIMYPEN